MSLPWECHNQSQDANWRHCVTGPELPFFHKRKGVLIIDQSVKMPWHSPSVGVASSCSSAPFSVYFCSTLLSPETAMSTMIVSRSVWMVKSHYSLLPHSLLSFWGMLLPFVTALNSIFIAHLPMYDLPNNIMLLFIFCLDKLGATTKYATQFHRDCHMFCIWMIHFGFRFWLLRHLFSVPDLARQK